MLIYPSTCFLPVQAAKTSTDFASSSTLPDKRDLPGEQAKSHDQGMLFFFFLIIFLSLPGK